VQWALDLDAIHDLAPVQRCEGVGAQALGGVEAILQLEKKDLLVANAEDLLFANAEVAFRTNTLQSHKGLLKG
jgi:hypothetical protein